MLGFRGSEHTLTFQVLDAMLITWRCVGNVILLQIEKTDEQNFPNSIPAD